MTRSGWIIAAIFGLFLLLFGSYLATHLYKETEQIDEGLQGEADRYPLLAAERFLIAMGIPTRRINALYRETERLDRNDALLILSDRQTMGQELSYELLEWVSKGGRLIFTVAHLDNFERSHQRDTLMTALGITTQESPCETEANYSDVDLPWANDILRIQFEWCYNFSGLDEYDAIAEDPEGIQIVRRYHGEGTVTILTDMDFLTWLSIGEYDHAATLWHLVDGKGTVWLVPDNDMPSLLEWLIEFAPLALTSAVLLLVTWLYASMRRFGPMRPNPLPARRRIMEHIQASGHYLWQHSKVDRLVNAVRSDVFRTAARRHPGWTDMNRQEQEEHIAEVTGITPEAAGRLLDERTPDNKQEFTFLIRQLKKVKDQL
jgi:hypothetical protein